MVENNPSWNQGSEQITQSEHIAPNKTGDNIEAKRVAGYQWNGSSWGRVASGLFTKPYDNIIITYTDSTKSVIATIVTKLAGVTQETITNSGDSVTDNLV